jgi:hypothetical protein
MNYLGSNKHVIESNAPVSVLERIILSVLLVYTYLSTLTIIQCVCKYV